MGWKYYIRARLSGYCRTSQDERLTKHFVIALFWLTIFRFKYPIVDLEIRNGYRNCDRCCNEGTICRKSEEEKTQ